MAAARFYLGTHHPHWLERADFPLFVSRRTLAGRKRLPRARHAWAEDSGGFTELSMHGAWNIKPSQYAAEVERHHYEIGNLEWAAPMDWMCEPFILAKTGKTIEYHQRATIENLHLLRLFAQNLRFIPVLQGWTLENYMRHVEMYAADGIDLRSEPLVGLGTICRRQGTKDAEEIIARLAGLGIPLHGFGLKLTGIHRAARHLASLDSMAWSFDARRADPLPECVGKHKSCANCYEWAIRWRSKALRYITAAARRPIQLSLEAIA